MPVTFDELAGSPSFSGTPNGLTATRRGKIAWTDGNALYQELFPPPSGGYPVLPVLFPGSSVLYAESVEYEPFVGEDDIPLSSGPATYAFALATIKYKTIPYTKSGASGQIITRKWSVGGEFLTYKNTGLQWANDAGTGGFQKVNNPEHHAGKLIPHRNLTVTLHQVTPTYYTSLQTTCDGLVGKVNNATWEGSAAETVLFLGGDFTQTVAADNSQTWQVELKFAKRIVKNGSQEVGWNYAFREDAAGGAKWVRLQTEKNDGASPPVQIQGDHIYPLGDFSTLYS